MACAICASVLRISGTPLTCTAPSFSSRSSADASSISAAALIAFSRTATRGEMHGVAGGHRLAAGEGAEAERGAGGVAGDHVDILRPHAEHVAGKLRQHRLGALALRARAGGDHDPAGRADAQARALERAAAGALDIVGEPEPEIAALLAAPLAAAPGNPSSRRLRARGAGIRDSRRCRRSWSSRRAA